MMAAVYPVSRDISMAVQVGNVAVTVSAESVSWNPDVADDMSSRVLRILRDAMDYAQERGVLCQSDQTVYFDDGGNTAEDDDTDGAGDG